MSFNERFGDIRHRLLDRPTPLTFARICKAMLEMWKESPERVNAETVPYVAASIAGWPDDARRYPGFLDAHWLEQSPHPLGPLALVRELDLSFRYLGPPLVDALTAQPQMDGLHLLDLRANRLDERALTSLAELEHLSSVRTLRLGQNAPGRAERALRERFSEALILG